MLEQLFKIEQKKFVGKAVTIIALRKKPRKGETCQRKSRTGGSIMGCYTQRDGEHTHDWNRYI